MPTTHFANKTLLGVLALVFFLCTSHSYGQAPSKTIRIIVPFSPGGGADSLARPLANHLKDRLGQAVIVENRPGAASNIGTEIVARAAPDGSTLLINTDGIAIYPYLYTKLNYDVFKDLVPITFVAETPLVLASNKSLPANTLKELIAFAKIEGNKFSFANPGLGTPHHLAFELFAKQAGVTAVQPVVEEIKPDTVTISLSDNMNFSIGQPDTIILTPPTDNTAWPFPKAQPAEVKKTRTPVKSKEAVTSKKPAPAITATKTKPRKKK